MASVNGFPSKMKVSWISTVSLLTLFLRSTDALNGKEIVDRLNTAGSKCKEENGTNWIPLPNGLKCGGINCDWPKEWCAIRSKDGLPDLFCQPLDPICQEAVKQNGKAQAKIISSASTENSDEDEEGEEITQKPIKSQAGKPITTARPGSDAQKGTKSRGNPLHCEDSHDACCYWAANGQCDRNPVWMKRTCRKSCGVCNCPPTAPELCNTHVNVENCHWLPNRRTGPSAPTFEGKTRVFLQRTAGPAPGPAPPVLSPTIAGGAPAPPPPPGITQPIDGTGLVPPPPGIAVRPAAPAFVPPQIQQPIQRPPVINGGTAGCQDRVPVCHAWASGGQCRANPIFMALNCAASCGYCSKILSSV